MTKGTSLCSSLSRNRSRMAQNSGFMSSSFTAAPAKRLEATAVAASAGFFRSTRRQTLLGCLLLTAVVLIAYNPVIHNQFVNYDDDGYIAGNPHVRAGVSWATVKWAFTTYDDANWHPLTWLSQALDCQLFGLNPAGHHYMSVLLHAANAVLLFLFLQSATGFRWRALMVGALFALHPINVESVAWASERKNVLSTLFFLLALYAYVWYARQPGLRRYSLVAGAFALSLLCKPQVITFPCLLWLLDYWPLRRISVTPGPGDPSPSWWKRWLVLEKAPLLALSAASAFVTMKAQRAGGTVKALSLYSLPLRLETAVISYVRYLGKALWPSHLVALYPHPTELYPVWQVATAVALLALVTTTVLLARNRRYLAVGWLWFLGSLVPMIGLVQVGAQAMADRYAYIPFIGLFLMLTWLIADHAHARQLSVGWLVISAASCLLALGTLTYRQVGYWHDTESFWVRTLVLTQNNFLAHDIFGYFLTTQGRSDEGATQFRAALAIRPEDPEANMNLGPYEQARGHLPAAIAHYQTVALYSANLGLRATAYFNLGHAYRQMGDLSRAKQCFEIALELAPAQPLAMVGLGLIAEQNGDLPEAVRQYSRALTLQPNDVGSLLLAHALHQEGRAEEAKTISDRVAASSPDFLAARKAAEALVGNRQ
jgi:tetratricopeptide (TPR) repeat protein